MIPFKIYTKSYIEENKEQFLKELLDYTEIKCNGDYKFYTDGEIDSNVTKYEEMLNNEKIIIRAKSHLHAKIVSLSLRYAVDGTLYLENIFGEDDIVMEEFKDEFGDKFKFKSAYTLQDFLDYFDLVYYPCLEEKK
jgi:hypothetical protein